MRSTLTGLFLLTVLLQATFAAKSQTVSLSKKYTSLTEVFKEIKKQTGYDFLYSNLELQKAKKIDIAPGNISLNELLKFCFTGQPFTYSTQDNAIVIIADKSVNISRSESQLIEVRGRIIDENGTPIPGANIKVNDKSNTGTISDTNGEFLLRGVAENAVLSISYLGYQNREIRAARDLGNITLSLSNVGLNEVQVIGYGTTTQRMRTGSLSSVHADEIGRQPVSNPLLALQGNVPGMYVTQSNGLPGGGINVSIRGQNSIGAGNLPLYIIDGVPFNAQPIDQRTGSGFSPGANGNTSPFSSINPSDIDNISVLKDADATAIYGSRAANGVVLITTKKGKAGKTKVTANYYNGFGNIAGKLKTLSTAEYLDLRSQAFINDGVTPTLLNAPDLMSWGTQNRDFQKTLIGNKSHITEASASVSGGKGNTTFLTSGTYRKEGSVLPGDKGYERFSSLLNLNHSSDDKKLNVSASVSLSRDVNKLNTQDITPTALTLPPNYPLYNSDGTLFWDNNFRNPLASLSNPFESRTDNVLANTSIGYHILPGLEVKASVGYNKMYNDQRMASLKSNSGPSGASTFSILSNNLTEGIIVEPQINYNRVLGKGKLEALIGGTYQSSTSKTPLSTGLSGFSSDKLAFNIASAEQVYWSENATSEYKYASVFGRLNYELNSKYVFTLSGRRDGSSRFGPNKKFGNFGAAGAAWIFSEEKFVKGAIPGLSFGKLRSSFGTVGNDQIADYGYLSTYQSNYFNYGETPGIYPSRIANSDFGWESTKKMELALDLGFVNNRILLSASAYRNRSNNMLVYIPLSPQTGFTAFQGNLPALVQNTGLEFEISTTNLNLKDFNWKSSFNLTIPRNKLLSFPEIESSTYANTYLVGQPLSVVNLYQVSGIKDGIVSIEDVNGDGNISPGIAANGLGDYVKAGQTAPKMFGGLSNTITYKNWQLDIFLQFAVQKGYTDRYNSQNPPGSLSNQDANILESGLKPTATFGSAAYDSYLLYSTSNMVFGDASFARLKNLSLSYTLPSKWTDHLKIQNCNIYARGQNLLTFTHYQGLDPETQSVSGVVVPPLRLFIIGIQCSL